MDAVGFGNLFMPGLGSRALQVISGASGQIYFRVQTSGSVFWVDLPADGPILTGAPAGTDLHGSISYAILTTDHWTVKEGHNTDGLSVEARRTDESAGAELTDEQVDDLFRTAAEIKV